MTNRRKNSRDEDVNFRALRILESNPQISQRELAKALGISLGGINYCLNALVEKGHVKIANFRSSQNKIGYIYELTPEGIAHRAILASRFIKRKMAEYDALKAEIESLQADMHANVPVEDG
ncbi:MarR family EPS-associated transcriptional regulator [Sphingopyxis witflariensis]|uniref:MarR family EPS-associated transcriptional regulator n=1 Tax=Sphingopyxis witflariensis TaxID=173675 RepID=A0A246K5G3_9SPHN|nr:MarR family EPS-associated transcriptional regulator [Sphingopyxis witflariensis]OWR01213.1 MarR family EPS-associated transcriptional regulator [Sphingopyxis witflariensis]